jgi:hypothetical protein
MFLILYNRGQEIQSQDLQKIAKWIYFIYYEKQILLYDILCRFRAAGIGAAGGIESAASGRVVRFPGNTGLKTGIRSKKIQQRPRNFPRLSPGKTDLYNPGRQTGYPGCSNNGEGQHAASNVGLPGPYV